MADILHTNMDKLALPPTDPSPLLEVRDLCFSIPERTLFKDWSTSILPGVTLVRGGESTGKTTLLRLLAGELASDSGDIEAGGFSLREQAEAYRPQVIWNAPRSDAYDQMTPVAYFESLHGQYPRFDEQSL